jgi:hypothetical protein
VGARNREGAHEQGRAFLAIEFLLSGTFRVVCPKDDLSLRGVVVVAAQVCFLESLSIEEVPR